ncbi:MAG: Rieske (2Fe-2S) protein [Lautropia sp.]
MPRYLKGASTADLREGEPVEISLEGRSLLVALVQGQVHAFDAVCSHGAGDLIDGCLDGYQISCPLHDGCFDIRDGHPTRAPAIDPIRCYPVRVDGEDVYVAVDAESSTPR